ncbi:MAG: NAD-dependent epimerase/dehydratase family protein [archaeon]
MNLRNKRFFVTGGAGFIGSHLADALIKLGPVTVYDNMSSGSMKFLEDLAGNPGFRLIKGDLLDTKRLSESIRGHDMVFHMAANPDVLQGLKNTELDLKQGTQATYNLLEAMRLNSIRRIAFASSGTVWGMTGEAVADEDFPMQPISLYGASKVAGECYLRAFSHIFGFQVWIFRFANVVGDRQTHGVIYDFIRKFRDNHGKLEILGDGKQTKHYLHTSDCISGMLCGVEKGKDSVNVLNLATKGTLTVTQIADLVAREMGLSGAEYSYTGGSQGWKGDVPRSLFSCRRIKKLGWRPELDSEAAVISAIRALIRDRYGVYRRP